MRRKQPRQLWNVSSSSTSSSQQQLPLQQQNPPTQQQQQPTNGGSSSSNNSVAAATTRHQWWWTTRTTTTLRRQQRRQNLLDDADKCCHDDCSFKCCRQRLIMITPSMERRRLLQHKHRGMFSRYYLRVLLLCSLCVILTTVFFVPSIYKYVYWHYYKVLFPKKTHGPRPPPNAAELLFGNVTAVQELYAHALSNVKDDHSVTTIASNKGNSVAPLPTIFYNVYIPDGPVTAIQSAVAIVKEQLLQVSSNMLKSKNNQRSGDNDNRFHDDPRLLVYYITIGKMAPRTINVTYMNHLCTSIHPQLQCELLHHYATANEVVTLQSLYEYCSDTTSTSTTVMYLHSKGSFHYHETNTIWRRMLTAAVTSSDCWNSIILDNNNNVCNVCGYQFYTQFTIFFPGNMWTARCDYIRQLIPPMNDTQYRERTVHQTLLLRLYGYIQTVSLRDRRDYFGLDRYSMEHWIGSHPSLVPCDMDGNNATLNELLATDQREEHNSAAAIAPKDEYVPAAWMKAPLYNSWNWSLAPRRPGYPVGVNWAAHERLHSNVDDLRREYYLLPGHIIKWYSLYGTVPLSNSWVWSWFPYGQEWYDATHKYGIRALEAVNRPLAMQHLQRVMGLDSRNDTVDVDTLLPGDFLYAVNASIRSTSSLSDKPFHSPTPTLTGLVVFYNIVFSSSHSWQNIIQEQLTIMAESAATKQRITVYIHVVGGPTTTTTTEHLEHEQLMVLDLCGAMEELQCHGIQHDVLSKHETGAATLQELYRYCTSKDLNTTGHRVAYLSNQLSTSLLGQIPTDTQRKNMIRHLTRGAMSQFCLDPFGKSCNVCGLAFYTMWNLFFPGNMFTATCDYVQGLIPPNTFATRMNDVIGNVLLAKLRLQITTSFFADRIDYFGMHRYAVEYWITSHPAVRPCDVMPEHLHFEDYLSLSSHMNISDFVWSMAPRRPNTPFSNVNATSKMMIMTNENLRRREFQFLAGHLLKWYALYNETPPFDSWVWTWFPDGQLWKDGVAHHGHNVVQALTSQFAIDGFRKKSN